MLKADHPFSFILFGASGHLARIKIFPALYFLALKKRLPESYNIVGFSRTKMTDDEFRMHVASAIREHVLEVNDKVLTALLEHVSYHTGQYDDVTDFKALATKLTKLEGDAKNLVRLAYLSIPPSAAGATLDNICAGGVHPSTRSMDSGQASSGQVTKIGFRCIVEKPVGHDLQSFEKVNDKLSSCLTPQEIYILDHYLGKEAVRNVYYLRHANPVIERLLKHTMICSVQITAAESAGLEGRAGYFDAVGTLRDMFQSHLIQIAALLTMRLMKHPEEIKTARLEAIKKFYLPSGKDLSETVMQGQYGAGEVSGKKLPAYTDEEGVSKKSRTPTFAAMCLLSREPRWEGVPIFLRSGKRLKTKETRIAIEFKESPTLTGTNETKNRLDIILQGEAGMKLYLQTKLGGSEPKFRPLVMEDPLVCMGDCLVEHSLLLLEAIAGNQQWYLDSEEVRACWQIIDPLQQYLENPKTSLPVYASGSAGPKEADDFIAKFGERWL